MLEIDLRILDGLNSRQLVVAFSTGLDSTALALLLIKKKLSVPLKLIHINHNLRPLASVKEEQFAIDFASKYQVDIEVFRLNPPQKFTKGLEDWAREARYKIFKDYLDKNPGAYICTAHHQMDLVESILMNLERGCGWEGLIGPRKLRRDLNLFRPLLNVKKEELKSYLQSENQQWMEDASNDSMDFNRNRWRRYLANESSAKWILDLISISEHFAKNEETYLNLEKEELKNIKVECWARGYDIFLSSEQEWSPQLLRHLDLVDSRFKILKAIDCELLLKNLRAKSKVQISRDLILGLKLKELSAEFILNRDLVKFDGKVEVDIQKPAKLELGPKTYYLEWDKESKKLDSTLDKVVYFCTLIDLDKISFPLELRPYKSTDCFSPRGLFSKQRSLKKTYSELKFSEMAKRERPVLAFENQVIWIPGYETNDFVKPTVNSINCVQLRLICQTTI